MKNKKNKSKGAKMIKDAHKNEALLRLEQLTEQFKLNPNIIKNFREGRMYYSYGWCFDSIEYNPKYEKLVKEFEKKYRILVYHVIENKTEQYGTMLSMLFVSLDQDWENAWELERLRNNLIMACVLNLDYGYLEIGDIRLASSYGALLRVDCLEDPYIVEEDFIF